MTLQRVVAAETLDTLAADDPAAQRSRRDLQRVHRAMGTRRTLLRALRELPDLQQRRTPLRVLELGAGDATLMLGVARSLGGLWPAVEFTVLDRQPLAAAHTKAAYARLGWRVATEVIDVFDWAARLIPSAAERWDLVITNLFLHHFEGTALTTVLAAIAARSDRCVACEPRRSRTALVGSHLVGAIGANAVTRDDAVLSVHAGFHGSELSDAWSQPGLTGRPPHAGAAGSAPRSGLAPPPPAPAVPQAQTASWHLQEYPAGLFSHCFVAERVGPW